MEKKEIIKSEMDHIGEFLVEIYYKNLFDRTGRIPIALIKSSFTKYVRKNSIDLSPSKIIIYLEQNKFLYKQRHQIIFIHQSEFHQFRIKLTNEIDSERLKQDFVEINEDEKIWANEEIIEPDLNSPIELLNYEKGVIQNVNNHFVGTITSCFICQKNFCEFDDYEDHIFDHGQDSSFKIIKEFNHNIPQHFKISYRVCKNSYLLNFNIENIFGKDVEIEKIVIVLSYAMKYIHDDRVPFTLKQKGVDFFYIDFHLLEIDVEQPFVIIFRYRNDPLNKRQIEQHHFIRTTSFPIVKMQLKSSRVIRRCEMKFLIKLPDYFPSLEIESVCNQNCSNTALTKLGETFQQYLIFDKLLTPNNIHIIFQNLLQMEDYFCQKSYKELSQTGTIKGFKSEYSIQLKHFLTNSTLQEGDEIHLKYEDKKWKQDANKLHLKHENKNIDKKFCGIISRISGTSVYFTTKVKRLIPTELVYRVSFHPGRYPVKLQHKALEMFAHKPSIREILFPSPNSYFVTSNLKLEWFSETIPENPEQMEAVRNIVDEPTCNSPYIIFGPPGTGKTTTIVETVLQLWKIKPTSRILITAGSNAACDEVCKRLCKVLTEIDYNNDQDNILRIYAAAVEKRSENLDELILEASNLCYGDHFYPSIESINDYRIIVATLCVVGRLSLAPMRDDYFTHIFIDECGASTEPESLIAIATMMCKQTRLILSGDPKQLGPVLQSKLVEDLGLGQSLLERLLKRKCYEQNFLTGEYNRSIQTRLIRNYRTNSKILYLFNHLYYDEELVACAKPDITNWALSWCRLPSKQFPIAFKVVKGITEQESRSKSLYNYKELHAVLNYVKDIMFFGINGRKISQKDIGIISPYKRQCDLIRNELNIRKWFQIETGSVETFQGKEKPIIIMSMVRSNTKGVGFLDSPKRLNVSLSRAQALLIIVGNPETLQKFDDWNFVIQYCTENNAMIEPKKNQTDKPNQMNVVDLIDVQMETLNMNSKNPTKKRRSRNRSRSTSRSRRDSSNMKKSSNSNEIENWQKSCSSSNESKVNALPIALTSTIIPRPNIHINENPNPNPKVMVVNPLHLPSVPRYSNEPITIYKPLIVEMRRNTLFRERNVPIKRKKDSNCVLL